MNRSKPFSCGLLKPGRLAYENVQFLLGGKQNDTFKFSKGGSVDGGVDGGFGGENTLDYSGLGTNDPVEITLNISNTNITKVLGTDSVTDQLVGLPFSNTWVINGENKGNVSSKEIVERALDKQAVADFAANLITFGDYVHEYDTGDFLNSMPAERIRYFHLAGHHVEAPDLRIDTHGSAVDQQSWALLQAAYERFGPVPTLLERDFNFPPIEDLLDEVRHIKQLQQETKALSSAHG